LTSQSNVIKKDKNINATLLEQFQNLII